MSCPGPRLRGLICESVKGGLTDLNSKVLVQSREDRVRQEVQTLLSLVPARLSRAPERSGLTSTSAQTRLAPPPCQVQRGEA